MVARSQSIRRPPRTRSQPLGPRPGGVEPPGVRSADRRVLESRRMRATIAVLAVMAGLFITETRPAAGQAPGAAPAPPMVRENATVKLTDHVWAIPDFNVGLVPNVGIIVGSKATLVVDTGLGPRNGA